jgi:hypothetical protein
MICGLAGLLGSERCRDANPNSSHPAQVRKPRALGCMLAALNWTHAPKSCTAAENFINDGDPNAITRAPGRSHAPSSTTAAASTPKGAFPRETPAPNRGRRRARHTMRAVQSVNHEPLNCNAVFPCLDRGDILMAGGSPWREQPQLFDAGRGRGGGHARQQLALGVRIQDGGVHKARGRRHQAVEVDVLPVSPDGRAIAP